MTMLISHPFRFTSNGVVATLDDQSDDYLAEQIAVVIQTRPGERQLVPGFGLNDPAFDQLSASELQVACDMYGPNVSILDVQTVYMGNRKADVFVSFQQSSEADDEGDS